MKEKISLEKGRDYIGVGVGAIVMDRDLMLLLKRRKEPEAGLWGIQGGAVEFGETVEDALKRELKEELSVEVGIVTLLGVTDHILPQEGMHWYRPSSLRGSSPAPPQTSREISTATCAGSGCIACRTTLR